MDRNLVNLVDLVSIVTVALRKESVDRNEPYQHDFRAVLRRSPQGERG